jgi:hypothetical protein
MGDDVFVVGMEEKLVFPSVPLPKSEYSVSFVVVHWNIFNNTSSNIQFNPYWVEGVGTIGLICSIIYVVLNFLFNYAVSKKK